MVGAQLSAPPTERPLTPAHYQELALANSRAAKIQRAAKVAAFNGWTMSVVAALSAPFAMFSIAGAFLTIGLAISAAIEFRGRRALLQFEPTSAALLGWNQVGLMALVVVYSLWMLGAGMAEPNPLTVELQSQPELRDALGSLEEFDGLYRNAIIALYGTVIGLSVIFQGLNAFYCFTRRTYLEAFVRDTPEWVLNVTRAQQGTAMTRA